MSLPNIQIFASLERVSPDSFFLDSVTDGVLDTSKLGGFITVNEAIDVPILSLSISRGRSRQLDRFTSGSATVVFDNRGRELDPLNTDSLFESLVVPRVVLNFVANGITIFKGFVTDWDIDYDVTGNDRATAFVSDSFSLLATQSFESDVTPDVENPGPRLDWVLDELGYLGDTAFDYGTSILGNYLIQAGTTGLDYMFQVQKSDSGYLFVSASGVLTYKDRYGRNETESLVFSDDGSDVSYMSLSTEFGDELLYNRILLESPAGSVSEDDEDSIDDYGVLSLEFKDLLNVSTLTLADLATEYLRRFSEPAARFRSVSLQLFGLSEEQQNELLRLDLVSKVVLRKSFSVGSPSLVEQTLLVTGINHRVQAGSYVVDFTFEQSFFSDLDIFILDDDFFGILDTNYLI